MRRERMLILAFVGTCALALANKDAIGQTRTLIGSFLAGVPTASLPATCVTGTVTYDSTALVMKQCTANSWVATASGGASASTNALNSATTTVNVSSATAPSSGQVLTATSSTAATWQTSSGAGSPYGYESNTTTTVLTSSSKKFQRCNAAWASTTAGTSISLTMPDCAAGTQGFEYVIYRPLNSNPGACVVLPGSGDTIDIHAAWVMSASGDSVTLVCDSGTNTWQASAVNEYNEEAVQWAWRDANFDATTLVTIGGIVPTVTGSAFAGNMVGVIGPRIQLNTAASTSDFVQFASSTATVTEFLQSPRAIGVVGLAAAAAGNYRWWPLTLAASTPQSSNALAVVGAGISASTSGDAQWQCCTYDGATASCVDIGTLAIPTLTNTTSYRLTLQTAFGMGVGCTVQVLGNLNSDAGTTASVWKTTNIDSAGTTDLGVFSSLTTLANELKTETANSIVVRMGR